MNFKDLPEEARTVAQAVHRHFSRQGWKLKVLASPWSDTPYLPSLLAERSGLRLLIEAQGTLSYHKTLKDYAAWLAARRHYAELHLATRSDCTTSGATLAEIRNDGVGWMVVDEDGVVVDSQRARNPALIVTPDPTLKYGDCRDEVLAAVKKFNEVDRKDGLRDMCEIVERETEDLALIAVRRNHLCMTEQVIRDKDWSGQINTLGSTNAYNPGYNPIIEDAFKTDLHSFRGARNLLDHKVSNKRDDKRRQMQFAERMVQGPRLVAELMSLKRRIR